MTAQNALSGFSDTAISYPIADFFRLPWFCPTAEGGPTVPRLRGRDSA
ncbi:hypothetical protein [Pseudonocardia acidicola]|uniref:Uncharacterized protein n=1 Tax=Pseudonocardia acidicola TaxID=2724939 RepID=A0ABX1SIU2_9PSEU|nr:hypothetical protein [Pseudonocardia acidicola]NMI01512.1 hypothetical protein [Pseudonocardia acidicola]